MTFSGRKVEKKVNRREGKEVVERESKNTECSERHQLTGAQKYGIFLWTLRMEKGNRLLWLNGRARHS